MKKISHFIKILSVGSGFLAFGFICLFANILLVPICLFKLYKYKKVRSFSRLWVKFIWGTFLVYIKLIRYIKYDFSGLDTLKRGSNLIIANHPSLLDVVFLLSHIENTNCIVKSDLRKNIFLYPAIKASGYILNTQNETFLQKGIEALKSGENLVIFPEGTRTKEEIVFHKAAVYMGLRGATYITPIIIKMNPRSLKKGQSWYNTPEGLIRYNFLVQEPLVVDSIVGKRQIPAVARELNKNLVKLYKKELGYE